MNTVMAWEVNPAPVNNAVGNGNSVLVNPGQIKPTEADKLRPTRATHSNLIKTREKSGSV